MHKHLAHNAILRIRLYRRCSWTNDGKTITECCHDCNETRKEHLLPLMQTCLTAGEIIQSKPTRPLCLFSMPKVNIYNDCNKKIDTTYLSSFITYRYVHII